MIQAETLPIYDAVASAFAKRVNSIFETEETLKAVWEEYFPGLPFDRTDKWNVILHLELVASWNAHGPAVKSSLTGADRLDILELLVDKLDYNLFSQVLLNLQNWAHLRYLVGDTEAETKGLEAKWAGKSPSPFDAKAKMFKVAANEEQSSFNRDLSTLKSLKIIAGVNAFVSFRVSPKVSTPALTDSCNLSMLGVGGDKYLVVPPGWNAYYFTWDAAPEILELHDDGKFYDPPLIPYGFSSKSGGETLNSVLAARKLAVTLFAFISEGKQKVILPRMTSLMILTDEEPERMEKFWQGTNSNSGEPWKIDLHIGSR